MIDPTAERVQVGDMWITVERAYGRSRPDARYVWWLTYGGYGLDATCVDSGTAASSAAATQAARAAAQKAVAE